MLIILILKVKTFIHLQWVLMATICIEDHLFDLTGTWGVWLLTKNLWQGVFCLLEWRPCRLGNDILIIYFWWFCLYWDIFCRDHACWVEGVTKVMRLLLNRRRMINSSLYYNICVVWKRRNHMVNITCFSLRWSYWWRFATYLNLFKLDRVSKLCTWLLLSKVLWRHFCGLMDGWRINNEVLTWHWDVMHLLLELMILLNRTQRKWWKKMLLPVCINMYRCTRDDHLKLMPPLIL